MPLQLKGPGDTYVHVAATGVNVSGDLDVDGTINVLDANAKLSLRASTGDPQVTFNSAARNYGQIYADTQFDILRINKRNASFGTTNELLMRDTYSEFTQRVTAPTTLPNDQGVTLTTKNFVQDYTLATDINNHVIDTLTLNRGSGNPLFRMKRDDVVSFDFIAGDTFAQLIRYDSSGASANTINIYDGYINTPNELRATGTLRCLGTPTSAGKLRLDEATNNAFAGINIQAAASMANNYTVIMPDSIGAPGERLECISVSGSAMTMGWV